MIPISHSVKVSEGISVSDKFSITISLLSLALSICLALIEIRRYSPHLKAFDAKFIPVESKNDAMFWLDVLISNDSAMPISIIKASVEVDGIKVDATSSVYKYIAPSKYGEVEFPITTRLPIHLPAYGAQSLTFAIPHHDKFREILLHLPQDPHPAVFLPHKPVCLMLQAPHRVLRMRLPLLIEASSKEYLDRRIAYKMVEE